LSATLSGRGFPPGPSQAAQIRLELPDGRRLFGAVPQVRDDTVLQCVYSKLGPKHRLAAWVRFLALSADCPALPVSAVSIGRGATRGSVAVSTFGHLGDSAAARRGAALDRLRTVVDLYDRGMRAPLPMVCGPSAQWAEARWRGLDDDGVLSRAAGVWAPSGDIPGERDQAEHIFLYGRHSDLRVLLQERPAPDEAGPGWSDETHRFGRLARRLWEPLLAHERLVVE
jgi:exodeoxyribonuclease V gamma subunit